MRDNHNTWTVGDCVEQLRACGFTCEAGALENNVGYKRLIALAGDEEVWRLRCQEQEGESAMRADGQAARIEKLEAQLERARERERVILQAVEESDSTLTIWELEAMTGLKLHAAITGKAGGEGEGR